MQYLIRDGNPTPMNGFEDILSSAIDIGSDFVPGGSVVNSALKATTGSNNPISIFGKLFGGGGPSYDEQQKSLDLVRSVSYQGGSLEGKVINVYGSSQYYKVTNGQKVLLPETDANLVAAKYGPYTHVDAATLASVGQNSPSTTNSIMPTGSTIKTVAIVGGVLLASTLAYFAFKPKKSLAGLTPGLSKKKHVAQAAIVAGKLAKEGKLYKKNKFGARTVPARKAVKRKATSRKKMLKKMKF